MWETLDALAEPDGDNKPVDSGDSGGGVSDGPDSEGGETDTDATADDGTGVVASAAPATVTP